MSLIAFAIRKPVSIVMITVGTVILGLVSLWHLPLDLFPDVDFPVLTITTRLSGYSPVHIEALITKPIEEVSSTVNNVESREVPQQGGRVRGSRGIQAGDQHGFCIPANP